MRLTVLAMLLAFLSILSLLSIPLPFSPVPISGQTLGIMLIGLVLSPQEAFWLVFCYILLGGVGLPIFAGGQGGLGVILGPTGGYLLAFLLAAPLMAFCKRKLSYLKDVLALSLGLTTFYSLGSIWLARVTDISLQLAFLSGVLPFLAADIFKAFGAIILARRFRAFLTS